MSTLQVHKDNPYPGILTNPYILAWEHRKYTQANKKKKKEWIKRIMWKFTTSHWWRRFASENCQTHSRGILPLLHTQVESQTCWAYCTRLVPAIPAPRKQEKLCSSVQKLWIISQLGLSFQFQFTAHFLGFVRGCATSSVGGESP